VSYKLKINEQKFKEVYSHSIVEQSYLRTPEKSRVAFSAQFPSKPQFLLGQLFKAHTKPVKRV
jgi:hypothetical protein